MTTVFNVGLWSLHFFVITLSIHLFVMPRPHRF